MTSDIEQPERPRQNRAESSFQAHKDRIAARNAAAQKAGRAQREERELAAVQKRRADERRVDEQLERVHQSALGPS